MYLKKPQLKQLGLKNLKVLMIMPSHNFNNSTYQNFHNITKRKCYFFKKLFFNDSIHFRSLIYMKFLDRNN